MSVDRAKARARTLLTRLHVPECIWSLATATLPGGEQERVNIARGFVVDYPMLLLEEPTAPLDTTNRKTIVELIREAKAVVQPSSVFSRTTRCVARSPTACLILEGWSSP
ncbi:hypothetical protein I6F26_24430 [Ensifer sp. IC3342]|nr:hypothetical protein [Ensifer sp. BRP08]MCA1449720.1 hypothetical protein [Ensifer sp. IC3342]